MDKKIADLRKEYTLQGLKETDVLPNPFAQFKIWLDRAIAAELPEPNAMSIATASLDGKPSVRMVLLKEYDERGFAFFTNYNSQKGQQLRDNPWGAIAFWWAELERQVRIEGKVEQVSPPESDSYFQNRPRDSQLGAWTSAQSEVIDSREVLEERLGKFQQEYENQDVPRPPNWGGFRLIPSVIEFWQGRPNRLHDRLLYTIQDDGSWIIQRLSP
ncbi:MAG TPA: pyridoxamine 5'-phosphate oxidase [Cyanobacteria bacterium UBA11149]|nr:pyridoxamine 5'-phosphate oxidase [Cyanobacteria bacterium UBA11367]HBE57808.1 pyridoxamine 5'-phosphate oxidase [Cyanobacteria bacterium UBA11366]HBK62509.1 pyridoxamine 5'-phosphate oxidase [Cyanobacteria bacterium UBA11166]HBR72799.1 pyridoxamine 5'-phosphate oxidase [Cyanobacteria bacterium UBA11159]HBS71671.1 pyridoxamine 5'-phosphate oxidase [Cyanobacteria bacterium UBA11153]HBW90985.1 pyridoxamine 5'-phosphate oxidase [Cyanobacteria bacterium UBA11149]HCA95546.1 pyridoxamine 5'-phos